MPFPKVKPTVKIPDITSVKKPDTICCRVKQMEKPLRVNLGANLSGYQSGLIN